MLEVGNIAKIRLKLAHLTMLNLNRFFVVLSIGPLFLCWFSWVVRFITWLISCWEENNFYYKLSNWQNDNCFHSKWQLRPFWVKYMPFYAIAQFVKTFVFFSAWAKSLVKWDNSREPTQKNRTLYASYLNCNYSDNELQM